jgi:hypothetical protein
MHPAFQVHRLSDEGLEGAVELAAWNWRDYSMGDNAAYRSSDEIIADFLRKAGLTVRLDGGWVYVEHNGKELWIGAEYGQSLDAAVRRIPLDHEVGA